MNTSVGTLCEKTLHAMLKRQYEPNLEAHEQPCMGYVADILRGDEIIEIQTRSFARLVPKLRAFLPEYRVTVVYPIPRIKWVSWIDTKTGECTKRRRSPKVATAHDALFELYHLAEFVSHPNFSLHLVFMEVEEYRNLDGWGNGGKRGSTRRERIPLALLETVRLESPSDYRLLLPANLPDPFTVNDYRLLCRCTPRSASYAVRTLCRMGVVARMEEKQGRAYLYRICN